MKTIIAISLTYLIGLIGCSNLEKAQRSTAGVDGQLTPSPAPPEGTIEFIRIPAGTFIMEVGDGALEVTIANSFDIGKNEITQKQWYEVTRENPSYFKEKKHCPKEKEHQIINGVPMCSNYPVESVTWNDVVHKFIKTLNERKGLTGCDGGYDDPPGCLRLPMEAEWEYATRAGSKTRYFWGDSTTPQIINMYAWWIGNSNGKTHRVESKAPNPWGLHDTNGNVWEYVQDHWDIEHKSQLNETNPVRGLHGSKTHRVFRGGGHSSRNALHLSSSHRGKAMPGDWYSGSGFRLVRVPEMNMVKVR